MKNLKKFQRIMAWIGIVLLVGMYVLALVFALLNKPWADAFFRGAIASTIIVPVVLYACIVLGRISGGKTDEENEKETEKH